MRKLLLLFTGFVTSLAAMAVARFPKPDFTSGYEYPDIVHGAPNELLWNVLDIVLLIAMMVLVVWAAYKKRSRAVIYSM